MKMNDAQRFGGALLLLPLLFTLLAFAVLSAKAQTPTITYTDSGEEFVGPFASWKNVKDYGAKGDGKTDDTTAIQAALTDFKDLSAKSYCVLYFPAGTYCIKQTLTTDRTGNPNNYYSHFRLVGADPATTTIKWTGAANANMLNLDAWYFGISRLTFEGSGTASGAVVEGGSFSSYCLISDCVFQNMAAGWTLGTGPNGAEGHEFLRCKFRNCTYAGIETTNFNSLNNYFLYCLFQNCQYGVENGAGNFHVADCVFLGSTSRDINLNNPQVFYIYGNTSVGSYRFIGKSASDNGGNGNVLVQANSVYETTDPSAINIGQSSLIDNLVKSKAGNSGPAVNLVYSSPMLSVGNRYTVQNPVIGEYGDLSHYRSVDDSMINPATIPTPTTLKLPGTPPNKRRKIFEVAQGTGDDAQAIQTQINLAAAQSFGTRPVVHLAKGTYSIARPLLVPAGSDLQLLGDAESSTSLMWSGPAGGTMLQIAGPSHATVSEMYLTGDAALLLATNADQPGGRIFTNDVIAGPANGGDYPCKIGFYLNGIEQSNVTLLASGVGSCDQGIVDIGGPLLSTGRMTGGQVLNFMGGGGNSQNAFYDVQNGGRMAAVGKYDEESGDIAQIVNLGSTTGSLTLAADILNCESAQTTPTYILNGFHGSLCYLVNSTGTPNYAGGAENGLVPWWQVTGDGSALYALVWGSSFTPGSDPSVTTAYEWRDTTSPGAQAAFIEGLTNSGYLADVTDKVQGAEPTDQFYRNTLAPLRAIHLDLPLVLPGGVSDLRLTRLFAQGKIGRTILDLRGGSESVLTGRTPAATAYNSSRPYELGMKFQSAVAGQVRAIRFWKDARETGTHTGHLWSATGTLLASVPFTGESAAGWQQQTLTSPVSLSANTTYTVSVNTNGYFVGTDQGLAASIVSGDLHSVADGLNGVYGTSGKFPTTGYDNFNYFTDVTFVPTAFIPQVATPQLSSASGVVTISDLTPGTTLRYTTDGSTPTPTHGAIYSKPFTPTGAVTITGALTIKAVGYFNGWKTSAVASYAYKPAM